MDLLGPLVELRDLRIPHHPLHWKLVDVAVAAQHLDRVRRDPHGGITGHEFTHRGPAAGVRRSRLDLRTGLVQELPSGLGGGVHIGQHRADHLEVADSLAELFALAGIGGCDIEGALGDPDRLGGDPWPAAVERLHRQSEAVALRADKVPGRDPHALEGQLGGGAAAQAHLVLQACDREARRRQLDDEAAQPSMARCTRIGDGEDRDDVGDGALADEPLGARDDVVVTDSGGTRSGGGDIRARFGLGQGERDELLAGGKFREPVGLLFVRAGDEKRQCAKFLDRKDQAGRGAGAAELLHSQADREQLPTKAAVYLRERQAKDVLRRK